jgi:predicted AAA+ superfamily ATPase
MAYERRLLTELKKRLKESRKFIQVIAGPRQVGKTTLALQLFERLSGLKEYRSADDTTDTGGIWIDQIWDALRVRMSLEKRRQAVLFIDEIQKIRDWSAFVKKNWDRDAREKRDIKLLILGSSRLLLMDGLSESLTGRYELSYLGHWSYAEMRSAFGFSTEEYQWFGGYPGAAPLIKDEKRYKDYIRGSIIEPTMTRDILLTTKVDKPALLRQMFDVGSAYSSRIISYSRMLGQLQDAGNTTTLARYLGLLGQAGLLSGLNKISNRSIESKGTIPKLQIHNTALLAAMSPLTFKEALLDQAGWGSVFENSVGTHLVDQVSKNPNAGLFYWREKNEEVDYVIRDGRRIIGIEAKSGDASISEKSRAGFLKRFPKAKLVLVGRHGIPYEAFMKAELADLIAMV